MKKLIFLILAIGFYSCQPSIKNNIDTLEKVFAMDKFEIEIHSSGCFGGDYELYEMKKSGDNYLFTSKKTKNFTAISHQDFTILKDFLSTRIGTEQDNFCTNKLYIRAGTYFNSVDYTDRSCSEDWNTLNRLLRFTDLIPKE